MSRQLLRRFVPLLVAAGTLSALSSAPAAATVSPSFEQQFVSLINQERGAVGLEPLATYWDLEDDARAHSLTMRNENHLYHNPDLASVTTNWFSLGENVGVGPTVDSLHVAFMNSPGHRANVLGNFNYVGVGVEVESAYRIWVTVVFMRGPAGLSSAPSPAATEPGALLPAGATGVGAVDPHTGKWYLRNRDGSVTDFYYGNPGDYPMMGDWDCDGTETPGLYRQADGYVYLRNSNTQGIADIRFYFGNPNDVPLAGDFDGDGCDTVSVYRPSAARVFIINKLGANEGGLGAAQYDFAFGGGGAQVVVGDFDGDGVDTVAMSTAKSDLIVGGDWDADGKETFGAFDPARAVFKLYGSVEGGASVDFSFGAPGWLPVAGRFAL